MVKADHGKGAAGDASDAAAEAEGIAVDLFGIDANGAGHDAVLHHRADLPAPARLVHDVRHRKRDQHGEAHHEDAVDRHFDGISDLLRPEHPLRQFDADFTRAEDRAIGLLQDQAQPPGREQRVQWPLIEVSDQRPFDQHSERTGGDERQYHRQKEVSAEQAREIGFKGRRGQIGDVGAEDHELAMRHVDDAHLAKDDGKAERHQYVDGKQDQASEALHREDCAEITNRIIAEHRTNLRRREGSRRERIRKARLSQAWTECPRRRVYLRANALRQSH